MQRIARAFLLMKPLAVVGLLFGLLTYSSVQPVRVYRHSLIQTEQIVAQRKKTFSFRLFSKPRYEFSPRINWRGLTVRHSLTQRVTFSRNSHTLFFRSEHAVRYQKIPSASSDIDSSLLS